MTEARVLGAVELVGRGGEVVDVTPRVRRLAALVVREGAVASVDWLVEAVWGDDVPAHAEGALQTLVSRLRAVLRRHDVGLEVLTRSPGYQVRAAPEALDVRRFPAPVRGSGLRRQASSR